MIPYYLIHLSFFLFSPLLCSLAPVLHWPAPIPYGGNITVAPSDRYESVPQFSIIGVWAAFEIWNSYSARILTQLSKEKTESQGNITKRMKERKQPSSTYHLLFEQISQIETLWSCNKCKCIHCVWFLFPFCYKMFLHIKTTNVRNEILL